MQTECSPSIGPMLPGFETCETVERTTSRPLTSSVAVSHARTLALQESAPGSKDNAPRSGQSLPASLASLGPDGSWLRTLSGYFQQTLEGSSVRFSETWPKFGMMRDGACYRLQAWVLPIEGNGSSFWPTPRVSVLHGKAKATETHGWDLPAAVKDSLEEHPTMMWPTPMSQNWHSGKTRADYGNSRPLQEAVNGQLNPPWVELLMGFPKGWTDLDI
jgi:hypothetical protein